MTQTASFPSLATPTVALDAALRRARYKAQHRGLALLLGGVYRGIASVLSSHQRPVPTRRQLQVMADRFDALLERDLRNVEDGYYGAELLFQFPWRRYAVRLPEMMVDARRIARRSKANAFDELPDGIDREQFPAYYLRTFHWQTDGWFSERSARLYDADVELLFGGAADVMRRMAIPPVVEAVRRLAGQPRVLDLACGTGRFLQQLHRALPRASLHGVDLSPPYVAYARRLLGPDAAVLEGNAEQTPFTDGYFDAVTSVFLFHELPSDARRRVVAEAWRVLKAGGTLVINDSVQLVDSGEFAPFLEAFHQTYHEPYYKGYVRDPLEDIVREQGFELVSAEPWMVSKVVVARKP
jgi:ubiquinone/menaquinone biosynthesis C-methylase UbiE